MKGEKRLLQAQRNALIEWAAEGLDLNEVRIRAAAFDPPFIADKRMLYYYRRTRLGKYADLQQRSELPSLQAGLALRDERVRRLQELAEELEQDIFGGRLWMIEPRVIGFGDAAERVELEEFSAALVNAYRGVLDDIAKEVGGRKQIVEDTGDKTIRVIYVDQDAHGNPKLPNAD